MSMLAINERRNITKMIMVIRNNFRSMWAFFHNFECINIETGRILNHESFLIKCKRRLHFICKQQFLCKKKKSRVKCSVHRIVNWIGPALRTPPPSAIIPFGWPCFDHNNKMKIIATFCIIMLNYYEVGIYY